MSASPITPSTSPRLDVKWTSPLKPSKHKGHASNSADRVCKRLFMDEPLEAQKSLSYDTITEIYPAACLLASSSTSLEQHARLADLVINLENALRVNHEIHSPEIIRDRILGILNIDGYEDKIVELALVLFYLDRDNALPTESSLVNYRAQEIEGEVKRYVDAHALATQNPLIPSGKTHYLMRAFAHMVITSHQIYNPGGLMVIQKLLSSPAYRIAKYLQPEHREHILVVTGQILTNPAFARLFNEHVIVHPTLADVIRLDLKLNPADRVLPVHAFYASLMAFFSDVRQTGSPNCYAIGALIYASENQTYKTFSSLIRWICEGCYNFAGRSRIPLRPYLDKRLTHKKDLEITLSKQQAFSLAPIEHIFTTLALASDPSEERSATPLSQTLASPDARALFHAYKSNSLVQLMLKVLEFANVNSAPPLSTQPAKTPYSRAKNNLIFGCMDILKAWCRDKQIPEECMDKVSDRLGECLWLEAQNENDVTTQWRTVIVGAEKISFMGDTEALARVFRRSLRVFYLKDGNYTLLPSLSSLQQVLTQEIEAVCEAYPSSVKRNLRLGAISDMFRNGIAEHTSQQINRQGIEPKFLNWSDLLILNQTGGLEETVLKVVYDISLNVHTITDCQTPYQFLGQLYELIFTQIDIPNLKQMPRILISTPGGHTWTLPPSCWQLLLDNHLSFKTFIQRTFFTPAQELLSSPVPAATVQRVIDRYAIDTKTKESMTLYFEANPDLTYRDLRKLLLERAKPSRRGEMIGIIEEEFSKITLVEFKLLSTLRTLDLNLTDMQRNSLLERLPASPQLPHHLADAIRAVLIDSQIAILDPYDIEIALCQAYNLPLPINMGDLNWLDVQREDPSHVRLMILFNWVREAPSYYTRSKAQTWESNTNFNYFEIRYPLSLAKSKS